MFILLLLKMSNNWQMSRISPKAIKTAQKLGYPKKELKKAYQTMNSLEGQDCWLHRGIYTYIGNRGHRINDSNYTINSRVIHYFDNGGTYTGFPVFKQQLVTQYGITPYVVISPSSAFFG